MSSDPSTTKPSPLTPQDRTAIVGEAACEIEALAHAILRGAPSDAVLLNRGLALRIIALAQASLHALDPMNANLGEAAEMVLGPREVWPESFHELRSRCGI